MFDAILYGVRVAVNAYHAREIDNANYFSGYRVAEWCIAALTASVTRSMSTGER
jgi:hypothetical protein